MTSKQSRTKEGNDRANPIWEEVFVKDEGRLLSGNKIQIARIGPSTSAVELPSSKHFMLVNGTEIPIKKGAPNLPIFEQFDATIVAQLRVEYAASLTLRFTAHLSRIGLDYYGKDEVQK